MINTEEAAKAFQRVVKGNNFMTPNIIRYERVTPEIVVELSQGTDFNRRPIYGVTVVKDGDLRYELNKICWSLDEAESYIKTLGGGEK